MYSGIPFAPTSRSCAQRWLAELCSCYYVLSSAHRRVFYCYLASYISFSVQIVLLLTEKLPQPSISLAYFTKKLYLCTRNDSRWGMWAGLCLPFAPATIFQDIIKRRLLALVLENRNPAKFHIPETR